MLKSNVKLYVPKASIQLSSNFIIMGIPIILSCQENETSRMGSHSESKQEGQPLNLVRKQLV
jgi:hypothetical protein